MALAIPVCWTVWGSRRDSWIIHADPENELDRRRPFWYQIAERTFVRDIFGYQIAEKTFVFTNVFFEGDEVGEQRSVQEVDYPHGLREQHCASLHMREDIYDCELQSVITVRAGLHFVHLWKRNHRMKLRRRMRYEVLLLCWTRKLPREVLQNIFEHILNPNR